MTDLLGRALLLCQQAWQCGSLCHNVAAPQLQLSNGHPIGAKRAGALLHPLTLWLMLASCSMYLHMASRPLFQPPSRVMLEEALFWPFVGACCCHLPALLLDLPGRQAVSQSQPFECREFIGAEASHTPCCTLHPSACACLSARCEQQAPKASLSVSRGSPLGSGMGSSAASGLLLLPAAPPAASRGPTDSPSDSSNVGSAAGGSSGGPCGPGRLPRLLCQ